MVEKNFNGDTKKLYIYKAGIQVGYEEYQVEETGNGKSIKSYTEYSTMGTRTIQGCHLILDNRYNTQQMEVTHDSSSIFQRYSFKYKDSEAHIRVDQESRTPGWEGKNIDKTIVWDKECLVIPSQSCFCGIMQFPGKYSYEKKGKQTVACGIVPKVIFKLEYLGEDNLEVDGIPRPCKRFQVTSSIEGTVADLWLDDSEDLFKFIINKDMVTIQSFGME